MKRIWNNEKKMNFVSRRSTCPLSFNTDTDKSTLKVELQSRYTTG